MGQIYISSDRLRAVVKADNTGPGTQNNVVIPGVDGQRICVTGYNLSVDVGGLITLQDDADTPNVLAYLQLAAGSPAPYADVYDAAFITAVGKGLRIVNPSGTKTYGHMNYFLA